MDIQGNAMDQLAALLKLPPTRINTDAAAARLGVSKRTMEEWRRTGCGPRFIKIGKKIVRYEIHELDMFAANGKRQSTSDDGSGRTPDGTSN